MGGPVPHPVAVALVLAVATVPAVLLAAPAGAAQDCTALRLSGPDRIRTATAISRDVRDRADTVVVARADAYPDALAAGPLAHASDASLLLTDGDGLSDATATEIQRLRATRAIVLGAPCCSSTASDRWSRNRPPHCAGTCAARWTAWWWPAARSRSPAMGLEVLRRAGTFIRHMVGESSLRADLERRFPLAGQQGAHHETLHHCSTPVRGAPARTRTWPPCWGRSTPT